MNDMLEFDPYNPECPSRQLVDRIGDRWTILVIGALGNGPLRHGDLAKQVAGISPKMLSQTLRALERDGLLTRTAHPEVPPRVVYELTEQGISLGPVLLSVEHWARAHMQEVSEARERFDATHNAEGVHSHA